MADDPASWLYAGRYYLVTMLSDVARGGMVLELEDAGPAPGRGEIAEIFLDDDTGEMTFEALVDIALPVSLVERFVVEARRRLPAIEGD